MFSTISLPSISCIHLFHTPLPPTSSARVFTSPLSRRHHQNPLNQSILSNPPLSLFCLQLDRNMQSFFVSSLSHSPLSMLSPSPVHALTHTLLSSHPSIFPSSHLPISHLATLPSYNCLYLLTNKQFLRLIDSIDQCHKCVIGIGAVVTASPSCPLLITSLLCYFTLYLVLFHFVFTSP